MPRHDNPDILIVAGEIERYLLAHPNAADSVEGIVKWWLKRQTFEQATVTVVRALECLVEKGLVVKTEGLNNKPVYKLCR